MPIDINFVKKLANEDITDIHSTTDLARILGVNVHTLRAEFSRVERIPLNEWLAHVKIKKIKHMLIETEEPCKCISFSLGFRREDVCARFFRRQTGMTMQEFRRTARTGVRNENPKK